MKRQDRGPNTNPTFFRASFLFAQENTERLRIFLSGVSGVIPFDEDDAEAAGHLRATLEKTGPIGPYDVLIAAQALRNKATLVTANVSEFARVRGLTWQD